MTRRVLALDCATGSVRLVTDLAELGYPLRGKVVFAIIEGDLIATGTLEPGETGVNLEQSSSQAKASVEGSTQGRANVVVVLDQMFRGYFADVIEREVPDAEVHEIVGRGVQGTVSVSERRFLEAASDDFDVLKVVQRMASTGRTVMFFTGDKRLASQAQVLAGSSQNVRVLYMPPNEFPGKESLARAMIDEVRRAQSQAHA